MFTKSWLNKLFVPQHCLFRLNFPGCVDGLLKYWRDGTVNHSQSALSLYSLFAAASLLHRKCSLNCICWKLDVESHLPTELPVSSKEVCDPGDTCDGVKRWPTWNQREVPAAEHRFHPWLLLWHTWVTVHLVLRCVVLVVAPISCPSANSLTLAHPSSWFVWWVCYL